MSRRARAIGRDFAESEAQTEATNEALAELSNMATELREHGRAIADVKDRIEDRDPLPAILDEAAEGLDRALDEIDSAIRTLEGGDDE